MTTVYDVPPNKLIPHIAEKLKKDPALKEPEWAHYVKTGTHREKVPSQPDWWYTRLAAVLRKVYVKGPIGSSRLTSEFGGYRDRGSKPNRAVKGSGSIARKALMMLEENGYLEKNKNKGRVVTAKGRSFLDNSSEEVMKELQKENKDLSKY